jgi:hypothetical protein
MIKTVHPVAGAVAILTTAAFWLSTVLSELFGSPATVVAVNSAIVYDLAMKGRLRRRLSVGF